MGRIEYKGNPLPQRI
ncbi:hypothetical protein CEXT_713801, partial [Caerostris extrusa]